MATMLVYRNDGRVIGPFESRTAAYVWAGTVPNSLFATRAEWEHAAGNVDFEAMEVEAPALDRPDWRAEWQQEHRREAIDMGTPMWVVDLLDRAAGS